MGCHADRQSAPASVNPVPLALRAPPLKLLGRGEAPAVSLQSIADFHLQGRTQDIEPARASSLP